MSNYLYDYNGVALPNINEVWDKETYPYSYIYHYAYEYRVVFVNKPVNYLTTSDRIWYGEAFDYTSYYYDGNTWVFRKSETGKNSVNHYNITWVSFNMYDINNNLVFPTTEPLVDETWQIQKSTLIGVADYFRSKTGKTGVMSFAKEGFSAEIDAVYDKGFEAGSDGATPTLQEKTVTENGEVTADEGYDGLSKVMVNVRNLAETLTAALDFTDYTNGTFVETLSDGSTVTHTVTLTDGIPTKVDDITIEGLR